MSFIKRLLKRVKYGVRSDSETYINYLKKKGMRIGERTVIFAPRFTEIDETRPWMIKIGNDVQITRGVTILTHGYDWSVIKGKYGEILGSSGGVQIGNNVFIGMNAIILKGVHVGNNVIIGAGSVVSKDIPDDCVVVGNPAKVVCNIDEYKHKRENAQFREAAELVTEYRNVYGKNPGPYEMAEFFWLYTGVGDDYSNLPEDYKSKMRLVGNEDVSVTRLKENEKSFVSLQAFLSEVK